MDDLRNAFDSRCSFKNYQLLLNEKGESMYTEFFIGSEIQVIRSKVLSILEIKWQ